MEKMKFSVRDLCYMALFTALIAACAQISIPLPTGVPLTLQTFAIMLAGIKKKKKKGTISVLMYVLLAVMGVPILANFTGGAGVVFGMTGGFVLSFPIMALIIGLSDKLSNIKTNKFLLPIGLVTAVIVNYICGMIYFSIITSSSLMAAFIACVLPFILGDIAKMVLAVALGKSVKLVLKKTGATI
jgi:biotin transport system substrate-specific component